MTDEEKWHAALRLVREEWQMLSDVRQAHFRAIAVDIFGLKEQLQNIGEAAGAATACAACGGQCCSAGKFHFTAVDLLVFLARGVDLFVPDFSRLPHCPYSTGTRCLMGPGYRPYNCITFICDMIEDGLGSEEKLHFYALCDRLKSQYSMIEESCERRFMGGLLQTFDKVGDNCCGMLGFTRRSE